MDEDEDDLRAFRGIVHWGLAGSVFWIVVLAAIFG
jgi:hypothetical protein